LEQLTLRFNVNDPDEPSAVLLISLLLNRPDLELVPGRLVALSIYERKEDLGISFLIVQRQGAVKAHVAELVRELVDLPVRWHPAEGLALLEDSFDGHGNVSRCREDGVLRELEGVDH
jgi:hypothetical protein